MARARWSVAWGSTAYGWLHVDLLVVPRPRGGRGTRIMDLAEAEAVARAATVRGSTRSTSRHGRSTKRGYVRFGELPDYPLGHARIFLTKQLAG